MLTRMFGRVRSQVRRVRRLARPVAGPSLMEALEPRVLLSATVWKITGTPGNDTIVVSLDSQDPAYIDVTMNGQLVGQRLASSVRGLRINGGAGDDNIRVDLLGDAAKPTWLYGGAGNDVLTGGDGKDAIYGGDGNDAIDGRGGDDRLYGQNGDDAITGGDGNDVIYGGAGNDTLDGQGGDDRIWGQNGDDSVTGGTGNDRIYAGRGTGVLNAGSGNNYVNSGPGRTQNLIYADRATDRLVLRRADSLISNSATTSLTTSPSDAQISQWYIDAAASAWKSLLGQDAGSWWWWYNLPEGTDVPGPQGSDLPGNSGGSNPGGSGDAGTGTNVQTPGVDEADVLKTDGHALYIVNNGHLLIYDTTNPAAPVRVADLTITGTASQIYLDGDKLVLISSVGSGGNVNFWNSEAMSFNAALAGQLDLRPWWGFKPQTQVTIYDVADPANVRIDEVQTIDGSVVDSRLVDGRVYTVIDNTLNFPRPMVITRSDGSHTYETAAEYRARLQQADPASLMPGYTVDLGGDGITDATGSLLLGQHDYLPTGAAASGMLSVVMTDPADGHPGPDAATTVVGIRFGDVYASAQNLYIATQNWGDITRLDSATSTDLYKFSLLSTGADLVATGNVPGMVLNQFSMDEYNGDLRIATSQWAGATGSTLSVLHQVGSSLQITGQLTGLAPGEQISAVRFVQDKAYLVTYQAVDPLFVVDLSNPASPRVTGELTIPGRSSYLQPLDAGHLIGLGRAPGAGGALTTLRVSLFDVTDPTHPTQTDTYDLPTGDWAYSSAEWDHHAFGYFPQDSVFALPVTTFDINGYTSSALVIGVDTTDGFQLLGQVPAEGQVLRTLAIGQSLYILTETQLIVADLHNLANIQEALDLPSYISGGTDSFIF